MRRTSLYPFRTPWLCADRQTQPRATSIHLECRRILTITCRARLCFTPATQSFCDHSPHPLLRQVPCCLCLLFSHIDVAVRSGRDARKVGKLNTGKAAREDEISKTDSAPIPAPAAADVLSTETPTSPGSACRVRSPGGHPPAQAHDPPRRSTYSAEPLLFVKGLLRYGLLRHSNRCLFFSRQFLQSLAVAVALTSLSDNLAMAGTNADTCSTFSRRCSNTAIPRSTMR